MTIADSTIDRGGRTTPARYHVLDETTGEYVYHSDREAMANAAANAHARDTGHDASVWEGTVDGDEIEVTNTGYHAEASTMTNEVTIDAATILDQLQITADRLGSPVEFFGPDDGTIMSLTEPNIDLDPAGDIRGQTVANLRALARKLTALADAIDAEGSADA